MDAFWCYDDVSAGPIPYRHRSALASTLTFTVELLVSGVALEVKRGLSLFVPRCLSVFEGQSLSNAPLQPRNKTGG